MAVVIGADPTIGYVSVSKMSETLDEFAVAGALRGAAVDLVPCETVPLEVPATAEIVLEGEIPANSIEPEGPFGEYTGYMGPAGNEPFFNIKCMTFRNKPLVSSIHQPDAAVGVELHSRRRPGVAAVQASTRYFAHSDQRRALEGSRRQRRIPGHLAEKSSSTARCANSCTAPGRSAPALENLQWSSTTISTSGMISPSTGR